MDYFESLLESSCNKANTFIVSFENFFCETDHFESLLESSCNKENTFIVSFENFFSEMDYFESFLESNSRHSIPQLNGPHYIKVLKIITKCVFSILRIFF